MQTQTNPDENQDHLQGENLNQQNNIPDTIQATIKGNHQNEFVVVLRCWKEGEQDHWQCSMKNIYTGESKFFMSLRQFEAYMNSLE